MEEKNDIISRRRHFEISRRLRFDDSAIRACVALFTLARECNVYPVAYRLGNYPSVLQVQGRL